MDFRNSVSVAVWRRTVKYSDIPVVCVSCRDIRVFLMQLRVSQDDVGELQTIAVQAHHFSSPEIRGRYVHTVTSCHVEGFENVKLNFVSL
jgi:hypothetical protein